VFKPFYSPIAFLSGPGIFTITFLGLKNLSIGTSGAFVLGTAFWMLAWWLFETVPLAVTAFLPLVLFPVGEILTFKELAGLYMSDVIFLFLGGFFLSAAVEKWHLHLWLSQHLVRFGGSSPRKLLYTFITATAFISMWISNTATTLIMLPLIKSLLRNSRDDSQQSENKSEFSKALLLGVAFSASIGGLGTPIGSPPNAILFAFIKKNPQSFPDLSFSSWIFTALPFVIIALIALGFVLNLFFIRKVDPRSFHAQFRNPAGMIQTITWTTPMTRVSTVFALMALFWILSPFFQVSFFSDAWISVVGAVFLFLTPTGEIHAQSSKSPPKKLLSAEDFDRQPWNILMLFGGGLALSEGLQKSGLISWVSTASESLKVFPSFFILLIAVFAIIFMTEIGSNTAIAAIFIPLASALSAPLGFNGYSFLFAVTAAASLSFMLPMATPPNAIAFSMGHFNLKEMIKVGFVLDLIFAIIIALYSYFLFPFLAKTF
jgi:sodium-dependent dicarboxylate transporter 2/3/5